MTKQQRFCKYLFRQGSDATLYSITGTQCPCMISRSAVHPSYSPEWHRENSDADHCNGTGWINRTTTTIAIKATFTIGVQSIPELMTNELKEKIGELQDYDLVMFGQCNASTAAFVDISSYTEQDDYISFKGNNYLIRHPYDIDFGATVGQVSLLKRKA